MRAPLSALILVLFSGCALGQTASKSASIQGTVSKDPGGEPVKKALIELIAEDQDSGGNYTALSSADGRFRIESVAPGRYRLFAERTGYLQAGEHHARSEGRSLSLAAGDELDDIVIRMQAAAVVSGRVTDADGEPLPNAQVTVLRQSYASGHRQWEQVGGERTNDIGEYRVPGLDAGTYFIAVTPPPDFKALIDAAGKATKARDTAQPGSSYAITYYPNTLDRTQAAPVQLHPGDQFPADFALVPAPSFAIRGSIGNLPKGASAGLFLQSRQLTLITSGAEVRPDGTFEIRDVAPGSYMLLATVSGGSVPLTATQTVQITSENIEGLTLTPQPGTSIRGRIQFEGAHGDTNQLFLLLHSEDDEALGAFSLGDGFSNGARIAPDGSFEWNGVPAGHYDLELAKENGSTGSWFLKSAYAGGRDINDAGFVANGGTVFMQAVASAHAATVRGVVTRGQLPLANAVVVAVPEARLRSRSDRFQKTTTDQHGTFSLTGMPPGEYTLLAWDAVDAGEYYDPEFLRSYEDRGTVLRLGEGDSKSLQIEAILTADNQQ